jgi:hypothetical protein
MIDIVNEEFVKLSIEFSHYLLWKYLGITKFSNIIRKLSH